MTDIPYRKSAIRIRLPLDFLYTLLDQAMHVIDLVLTPLQNWLGTRRMAYFFVLPNLLIFGIFILLPMLLNFYYAFTGGSVRGVKRST